LTNASNVQKLQNKEETELTACEHDIEDPQLDSEASDEFECEDNDHDKVIFDSDSDSDNTFQEFQCDLFLMVIAFFICCLCTIFSVIHISI